MFLPFLLKFVLRGSFCLIAVFLGNSIGFEGTAIMTTGLHLVLFSILIFALIFLFRFFCVRLNQKCDFLFVFFINLSILFLISFFCNYLRIYFVSCLGLHFGHLFSFLILSVEGSRVIPYSGPSNSSSWTEDSFEIRVLMEPFSETEVEGPPVNRSNQGLASQEAGPAPLSIHHNVSMESSIKNRILYLENHFQNTIFLGNGEKGDYWKGVKETLDETSSQSDYNFALEIENEDLQIREAQYSCYDVFLRALSEHPDLLKNAPEANPEEALSSFFYEIRYEMQEELEHELLLGSSANVHALKFIKEIENDILKKGATSYYVKHILGYV